jgi:hypothetical protein
MNAKQKKQVLDRMGLCECVKVDSQYSASFYRIISPGAYTAISHGFGKTESDAISRVYVLVNRWMWNLMFQEGLM